MKKKIQLLLTLAIFTFLHVHSQVNVNVTTQINGFRHNWDCNNDGVLGNDPDPRYQVWIGWNGANFAQVTGGPQLPTCAGLGVYGADQVACSNYNPGVFTSSTFFNIPATQLNVDMKSWEDDDCSSTCTSDNSCTFNDDDTRCGRLRIGDINIFSGPPCTNNNYNGDYLSGPFLSMTSRCSDNNGAGYGINQLIINWSFATSPTITTQPTVVAQGGPDRTLCIGTGTSMTVAVNSWNGWSLGMHYQWQVNTLTTNPVPTSNCPTSGWVNIPGATSATYVPPQTAGTFLYRCLITSNCTPIFTSQTTASECVRITYHPFAPPIVSSVCGLSISPGTPYSFCTTVEPNANASINNTTYTWTVSPSAGVTIATPSASCTNITFTTNATYTVTLTYGDACAAADAFSTCTVIIADAGCNTIYVDANNGNDANLGYEATPVQTVNAAFALAVGTRKWIRIEGGVYTEPNILVLQNDLIVEGGWVNTSGIWTKSSAVVTTINLSGEQTINGSVIQRVGFKATSVNNWALQDLIITTTNTVGTAADGRGKSNYGVLIDNCTGYTISRCNITSGNAANGTPAGVAGSTGANGSVGGSGFSNSCGSDDNSGKASGPAGSGGVNAWGNNGANGGPGGATTGGTGMTGATAGVNASSGGQSGGGAGSLGSGSGSCNTFSVGGNGGAGGSWVTTTVSTGGINGGIAAPSDIFAGFYTPSGLGSTGGHGFPGAGGGGGGPSRGQSGSFISCVSNSGNSGGGGGGGGGGGQGGNPGIGGGGSFAIYRNNSGTTSTPFVQVILNNGSFGNGGVGTAGGNGGSGLVGGNGPNQCPDERGDAGDGGTGGNGARGGSGQTGASGVAGKVYTVTVGFTDPSTSIPNPTTLTIDYFENAKGCINSEIIIARTSGGPWALPVGATFENDVNSTTSSFGVASNNATIIFSTPGVFDLTTSGQIYSNEIRITDGTRTLPIITVNPTVVCSGAPFSLSGTTFGTEIAFEWIIFTDSATVPSNVIASSTLQIPSFTLAPLLQTTYNIRYRVKEQCCGWSAPVYSTVTVNPAVTTPTTPVGATTFCVGTVSSPFITTANNASSYSWTVTGTGNTVIGTGSTGTVFFDTAFVGLGQVCVTADGCAGPTATVCQTFTVNGLVGTPAAPIGDTTALSCIGGALDTFVTYALNASSYIWTVTGAGNGIGGTTDTAIVAWSATFNGIALVCVEAVGCGGTSAQVCSAVLVNPPVEDATTPAGTNKRCQGIGSDVYTTSAVNAISYNWTVSPAWAGTIAGTTSSETVNWDPSFSGTASVCVEAVGCSGTSNVICFTVTVDPSPPTPSITVNPDTNFCIGGSTVLTSSSPTNNNWLPNNETTAFITVTQTGSYAVEVTNSFGCTSTSVNQSIVVFANTINPNVTYQTIVCQGTSFNMLASGTNVVSYSWSTGNTTSSINQTITTQTIYSVTMVDNNGCIDDSTFFVDVYPLPNAINDIDVTNQDTALCVYVIVNDNMSGNLFIFTAPANGFISSISGDSICYTPNPGFYGTDFFVYELCNVNCPTQCDTARVTLIINKVQPLVIPPGFSPNGDGINDVYNILGIENYPENTFSVINRWGDIIYTANPYNSDWNGVGSVGLFQGGGVVTDGTYYIVFTPSPGATPIKRGIEIRTGP